MGAKYIYRMDDITPDMNWKKFHLYMDLFKKYNVKPLLGVVPENRDIKLSHDEPNREFWSYLRFGFKKGFFEIAQHGYQHLYETNIEGILSKKFGFKSQSEFAGLDYLSQYSKLLKGKEIMEKNGIYTNVFMAPSHSFDYYTLRALYRLDFKYITDGIGLYPFSYERIKFIPQQSWAPRKFKFGIVTICLHTNTIKDNMYERIEKHLKSGDEIVSFSTACKINYRLWHPVFNHVYKSYIGIRRNLKVKEKLEKFKKAIL